MSVRYKHHTIGFYHFEFFHIKLHIHQHQILLTIERYIIDNDGTCHNSKFEEKYNETLQNFIVTYFKKSCIFFNIFEHWFMIKNKEFLVGDDPWFWRKYRKREKTMKL